MSVQAIVTGSSSVSWRSADDQIVRVNSNGMIASLTSQGPGTTTVTATAGTVSAAVTVAVTAEMNVSLSATSLSLTVDDEKIATVNTSTVASPGVIVSYTWSSANPQVATVLALGTNGASATVTAVGTGSTAITLSARTQFGLTRTTSIPVSSTLAVRAVILNEEKTDVGVGRSIIPGFRVTGDPTFPKTVTWSSSSTAVATIDPTGRLTALTPGYTTIMARSTADPGIRDSVAVQVTATPYALADFALIPAGSFQMSVVNVPAEPPHQVTLTRPFLIQRTEVTQNQWHSVMGINPSRFQQCGADCPVEQVSWNDVQIFIGKLNDASPGVTYRLLTEAEWEYAARAGSAGPWYGSIDSIGWVGSNSSNSTHPVAQKKPNAWGLYDMIGNVGEWMQDFLAPLSAQPVTDPVGPTGGIHRIIRGESYATQLDATRIHSNRGGGLANSTADFTGLRLARSP